MDYFKQLNIPLSSAKPIALYGKSGSLVLSEYIRVVLGGRGPYVEFSHDQIKCNVIVPDDQRWRLQDSWKNRIFYTEYRTVMDNIMVYQQIKKVSYADYIPDLWYISPYDLCLLGGKPVINGKAPKFKIA